jgi:hypothetical protein
MIPKPTDGAPETFRVSTPMATLGVFVQILRERFSAGASIEPTLPFFLWDNDPNVTKIFIEAGWDENLEARNVRPGIWVDRDQNVYSKVSIGDQDQMPVYKGVRLEQFYCKGDIDIIVDCTSTKPAESAIIGSVVQDFLHMSSNYIQALFGLHNMSAVVMNRTTRFAKDDTMWTTLVHFRTTYEARWATLPVANVLNEVALKIRDIENPETFFLDIVLRKPYPLD